MFLRPAARSSAFNLTSHTENDGFVLFLFMFLPDRVCDCCDTGNKDEFHFVSVVSDWSALTEIKSLFFQWSLVHFDELDMMSVSA